MVNRNLEKTGNQAFFTMHCKFTLTTVQCRYKKIMKLLILWLNVLAVGEIEFYLHFQDFSRSEKLLRKFHDFFKNSRLCTRPGVLSNHSPLPPWQKEIWCLWETVNNMAATAITPFISFRSRSGWGHLTKQ